MHHFPGIDASSLSRRPSENVSPAWWGMLGTIAIGSAVMATMLASYLYLSLNNDEWPPPGIENPDPMLPTLMVALLLISSFILHRAGRAARLRQINSLIAGLLTALFLGLTSLALLYFAFIGLPYRWDTHSYGSLIWVLFGFNGMQLVLAVVGILAVTALARGDYFETEESLGISLMVMFWQFTAVTWTVVYAFVFALGGFP